MQLEQCVGMLRFLLNMMIHNTERKMALIAGCSMLLMAVVAGWAYGYLLSSLYNPQDAEATFANIQGQSSFIRWFVCAFMFILLLDIIVAWSLYVFFEKRARNAALLMCMLRLVYAPLLGIALYSLLKIMDAHDIMKAGEEGVMLSIQHFMDRWSLGLIVFGYHLLVLGYVMIQSKMIPRVLGFFTVLAGVCYVTTSSLSVLIPNYNEYKETVDTILSLPMALGELGLAVWLVIKGGKVTSRL